MSTGSQKSKIIERAAEFHARIGGRQMTAEDWQELEAWINEDPGHRRILESMGDMAQSLRLLGGMEAEAALPESVTGLGPMLEDSRSVADSFASRSRRWPSTSVALAASLLVAVGLSLFFIFGNQSVPAPTTVVFNTDVGERKTELLTDGSSVVLNADTRLVAAFSPDERRLKLQRGEIFVNAATDTARTFYVEVGKHVISVTGTAFNVRFRDEPARVTVAEGRVAVVETAADAPPPTQLHAGQRLVLEPESAPVNLSQDELRNESAWRGGWLQFDDEKLAIVAKELNLYVDKRIIIGSRRAGDLQVAGSFNVDNVDALLTSLESVLPITVTHKNDLIVIDYNAP